MIISLDIDQTREALEQYVQNNLLNEVQQITLIRITRVNGTKGATAEVRVEANK